MKTVVAMVVAVATTSVVGIVLESEKCTLKERARLGRIDEIIAFLIWTRNIR